MQPEPYSHVRPDDYNLYTTQDEEAPETEVEDLIAALVNAIKPKVVVETGTARGFTAQRIGHVLEEIGRGKLYSFEVDLEKAREAQLRCSGYPVFIHMRPARSVNVTEFAPVDMLFIDAVLEERAEEYLHWEPVLVPGGIAVLHDTLKFDPPKSQVEQLPGEKLWMPTPRGVTLLQKPRLEPTGS